MTSINDATAMWLNDLKERDTFIFFMIKSLKLGKQRTFE